MKEIPLTMGKVALVDDEDYQILADGAWGTWKHHTNKTCYAKRVRLKSDGPGPKTIWMHRVILGAEQGEHVDHRNGNGLDNRKENLRICTSRQNHCNRRPGKRGSSRFKGVSWFKQHGKWRADIRVNGVLKYLGLFDSELRAAHAYNRAAERYFGEFAQLNNLMENEYE